MAACVVIGSVGALPLSLGLTWLRGRHHPEALNAPLGVALLGGLVKGIVFGSLAYGLFMLLHLEARISATMGFLYFFTGLFSGLWIDVKQYLGKRAAATASLSHGPGTQ
jgi:hypothetical protein